MGAEGGLGSGSRPGLRRLPERRAHRAPAGTPVKGRWRGRTGLNKEREGTHRSDTRFYRTVSVLSLHPGRTPDAAFDDDANIRKEIIVFCPASTLLVTFLNILQMSSLLRQHVSYMQCQRVQWERTPISYFTPGLGWVMPH